MSVKVQSLGYVVNGVLADLGLPQTAYFQQFLHWTIKGYKAINLLGMMPTIKTVNIVIDQETMTAQLPLDYIDYIRIGVNCNGTFINFDYNQEIVLNNTQLPVSCCGSDEIAESISCLCNNFPQGCNDCNGGGFGGWWWPTWSNGFWDYSLPNFGVGPGYYHGGFRINQELKTIQFDNCVKAQNFVMEYKSTGVDINGDAVVPEDALLVLNAYVHWQRCLFFRASTPMETRWIRQEATGFQRSFITYLHDWNNRENALTKYDYLDTFRRFTFQAIKT